ncbi:AMP-binding protein [Amycolatopsis sp. K13G38]|uniref:AMP-binding protein n=1 Tax=Amycolatopsis acididurans TaxID=2724524 RepID=A0ABX1J0T9_9PSEU|nr:AMP-binding protein [Amycolatopsis acididurans]NKQ51892.1 AMP-binding protein [Amycolatopsis acididurans]
MDFDVTTLRGRRAVDRWNRMAVGDVLERLTWSRPDRTAITGWRGAYGDEEFRSLTYRQADEAANRVAHALLAEGLSPGDRVLLYCDNSVEAIVLMIGIAKAGLVAVPVNPMLAPDVLAWVVEHVDVSFAVVDAEFVQRAANVLPKSVTIPIGGPAPGPSFHDWIREHPATEVDVAVHADDVWSLVFTSGTTAMPKASMTTHTYSYLTAYSYAMSLTRGLAYEDELKLATFLPIVYHCGHNSAVLPAFFAGGTVVLGRRPDAAALADAVTAESITALWAGSPLWLNKLVDEAEARPEVDLCSLTVAMFSWGAMQPGLFDRVRAACGGDVALLEVFGQTESMSCFRFWPDREPGKAAAGVNHVGVPNPMLAADIVDEEGRSLRGRPGLAGEAVYRSPVLTAGYYRDHEATAEAFRGGWFHSGDSCAYEVGGGQIMVDRFKDIVKSGGENVSSMRVEAALAEHPAVERVAVIGLPDDTWGEIVAAVVQPKPGERPGEGELIAHARQRLAGYESPKRILYVDEMPQTVGGKILKYRLRQRFTP